jgi:hypothetical protein
MELDRCSDITAYLNAYALGQVDETQSMRVQLHLAEGCVGCATRLEEMTVRFHLAALPEQPIDLPEAFSERVLAAASRVEQERPEPVIVYPQTPERALLWTLLALSLLMVSAVAFWGHRQEQALSSALARADFMEQATTRTVNELRSVHSIVRRLGDPRSAIVDVSAGSGAFATVQARIHHNQVAGELWLRVLSLPPTDTETSYALWLGEVGSEQLVGVLLPQVTSQGGSSQFEIPADGSFPARLSLRQQSSSSVEAGQAGGLLVFETALTARD